MAAGKVTVSRDEIRHAEWEVDVFLRSSSTEGYSFKMWLLKAISKADYNNLRKLAISFPALVLAWRKHILGSEDKALYELHPVVYTIVEETDIHGDNNSSQL